MKKKKNKKFTKIYKIKKNLFIKFIKGPLLKYLPVHLISSRKVNMNKMSKINSGLFSRH